MILLLPAPPNPTVQAGILPDDNELPACVYQSSQTDYEMISERHRDAVGTALNREVSVLINSSAKVYQVNDPISVMMCIPSHQK